MAQVLERLKTYEVPPHIAKELGLSNNWKENVSEEFLQKVVKSVNQYKDVLKRLSDK
ncbi:hypothetical protein ABE430_20310 [Brevibacillus agri]|uniref:hypothetical protein n=1 Tax=Brevibacillus agri TaxID=51101 RepID=UPI003D1C6F24